jgi:tRNA pseudouridine38-40 synthase
VLLRLTLAYDGTGFEGWQVQSRAGARTVQGVLESGLSRLCGGALVRVHGAGRTDAGVHALGQVASLELPRAMAPAALERALNALLPEDVRVLRAEEAPPGFHARRSAVSKHYRYVLDTGPVQLPQRRHQAAHLPGPLDGAALRAVAALYLGRHDFASLASSGGSVKTSVRSVTRSEVAYDGEMLVYDVEAGGFLRKMVRSMVGGLLAAGRGERGVEDLAQALLRADRRGWPPPAEARGLTLVRVAYAPPERAGASIDAA